ncbi:MAG: ABC transporter ATP-binding protein [Candidatus Methylumidiphilus sp.]
MRMLSCDISKITYGNHQVLANISFQLKKGEFLLVTGHSASGKSTLLSFIAGILQKDKNVKINGQCIFSNGISAKSIAYISQNPEANLICYDTKSEILLNGCDDIYNIDKVLDSFQFTTRALEGMVQNLSGGEQQLLSIICAVLRDCQIYIFDEPTAMLDYQNTKIVVDAINKLKKSNKTVIVASHTPDLWELKDSHIQLGNSSSHYNQLEIKYIPVNNDNIVFEAKNISFGYKKNEDLIRDLSLILNSGDVLHIAGKNGTGKTTLAKILAGLINIKKGEILLNGAAIKKYKSYLPKEFSYSFQNPNWQLLFDTVREEVTFCKNEFKNKTNIEFNIFDILENIFIDKESDPHDLSFGQRKFIANNSFLNFPKIHLFDEPEIGLDETLSSYFYDYISLRKKMGLISIVISHRAASLEKYITKEVVLG